MKKTDWSNVVLSIMAAEPPRGKSVYTYGMIKAKTGICESTLSRLSTGTNKFLYYDEGVKLIALYDSLKAKGSLKK